jgi:hypothetical protein
MIRPLAALLRRFADWLAPPVPATRLTVDYRPVFRPKLKPKAAHCSLCGREETVLVRAVDDDEDDDAVNRSRFCPSCKTYTLTPDH